MALPKTTVSSITADTMLVTSKTKIETNTQDLFTNTSYLEANKLNTASPTFSGPLTGDKMRITPEGGLAVALINQTGTSSVKGSVVSAGNTSSTFVLQSNEFDSIGAVYESGIAQGSTAWIVVAGIAEVLLANNTFSTASNWVVAHSTDGRADASQPTPTPNTTTGEHTLHFKEIGHCLETKAATTSEQTVKIIIHFN